MKSIDKLVTFSSLLMDSLINSFYRPFENIHSPDIAQNENKFDTPFLNITFPVINLNSTKSSVHTVAGGGKQSWNVRINIFCSLAERLPSNVISLFLTFF